MEKISYMNSFFVFVFSLLLFFLGNYHSQQFFTSKFSILFSYNGFAPLIFCFGLNSTKIHQLIIFFLLSQFYRTFNTFHFMFNFKRNMNRYLPNGLKAVFHKFYLNTLPHIISLLTKTIIAIMFNGK